MSTVRINLLPWREEQRKRQNIEFGILAGVAAVIGLLIALGVSVFFQQKNDYQTSRNQYLESEIQVLKTRIKRIEELDKQKKDLLSRMRIIEELQSSRAEIVHLFEELVNTLPDGVWLQGLKQQKDNVSVTGFAESNARVSAFMRNLDESSWISQPSLISIDSEGEDSTGVTTSKFSLIFNQESPSVDTSSK